MLAILQTYESLLADVAMISGFSEIRGSIVDLHWCLNEAPSLEKSFMKSVEEGESPNLDLFPNELKRLAAGSVQDPVLLRLLRQLLLFAYKAYVTHDKDITLAAYDKFAVTNREVGQFGNDLSSRSPMLLNLARKHCMSVLSRLRPKAIKPFHGPGATTTPKGAFEAWYDTIEYCYPYSDYASCYFNQEAVSALGDTLCLAPIEAKLIAVPKDSRGPRLICVHPSEAIWFQQGLRRELERVISLHRTSFGPWPQGHIHFKDQSVNGKISLLSSRSRRYATIDMKEASDRIAEPLVQILFGSHYKWFGCCRAQKYRIPASGFNPEVRDDIYSYAPMGNATTFPVQSLVFWAICVASMQYRGFHQPGAAFVFGDDIIIPTQMAPYVVDDLESFGLVVNRTKSFWRGSFRESCGVDAFKGVNVTPVRWKTTFDAERLLEIQSLSDIAMRLRIAGYLEAARTSYSILRARFAALTGKPVFFTNNRNHGGIAELAEAESNVWRDAFWHRDTQWYRSPVWSLQEAPHRRVLVGWNHVLESLLSLEINGASGVPDRSAFQRTKLGRTGVPVL